MFPVKECVQIRDSGLIRQILASVIASAISWFFGSAMIKQDFPSCTFPPARHAPRRTRDFMPYACKISLTLVALATALTNFSHE
jgi:hypothetical protein